VANIRGTRESIRTTEMKTVRWICCKRLWDKVASVELRDRLGIESVRSILQRNRLRWFGHLQRIEDDD